METLTMPTYCGVPVGEEYSHVPQWFFDEVESYFVDKWVGDAVRNMLEDNLLMSVFLLGPDFQKEKVLHSACIFLFNRVPGRTHWGSEEKVKEYLEGDKSITREELGLIFKRG